MAPHTHTLVLVNDLRESNVWAQTLKIRHELKKLKQKNRDIQSMSKTEETLEN